MALNVGKEIAALKRMTVRELRAKHAEVFGEETRSGHKQYLVKRIAWRIQALAEGGLSEQRLGPYQESRAAQLGSMVCNSITGPDLNAQARHQEWGASGGMGAQHFPRGSPVGAGGRTHARLAQSIPREMGAQVPRGVRSVFQMHFELRGKS